MAENIMRVNWSYTYDVHVQDGWRVLKFVSDLWNLLFFLVINLLSIFVNGPNGGEGPKIDHFLQTSQTYDP